MQKKIESFDKVKINYGIKRISKLFLVFIHGAGGDLNVWKKQRHFFHKKGFSTLAIDLRGHGFSDRPDSVRSYRLEHFAKDIYHILIKEKITKFIMIGHCFGGMVTITFHKLFPKLSKAYILIDTTYKAPQFSKMIFNQNSLFMRILNYILKNKDSRKKYLSHVNFDKFKGTGDLNLKRIYSDITHTSLKSWLFTQQNIAQFDGIETLKRIDKPVFIIEGLKDSIFPPKIAKEIHKLIKSSTINVIPNANHILVINNIQALERCMLSYLISIEKLTGHKKFLKQKVS